MNRDGLRKRRGHNPRNGTRQNQTVILNSEGGTIERSAPNDRTSSIYSICQSIINGSIVRIHQLFGLPRSIGQQIGAILAYSNIGIIEARSAHRTDFNDERTAHILDTIASSNSIEGIRSRTANFVTEQLMNVEHLASDDQRSQLQNTIRLAQNVTDPTTVDRMLANLTKIINETYYDNSPRTGGDLLEMNYKNSNRANVLKYCSIAIGVCIFAAISIFYVLEKLKEAQRMREWRNNLDLPMSRHRSNRANQITPGSPPPGYFQPQGSPPDYSPNYPQEDRGSPPPNYDSLNYPQEDRGSRLFNYIRVQEAMDRESTIRSVDRRDRAERSPELVSHVRSEMLGSSRSMSNSLHL